MFTDWPGQGPQEVEDQVTYPLTTNLQGLAGVRVVRSQSAFGFSMVYVVFEDDVDLYFARTRVLERMNLLAKSLPAGVVPTLGPDATGVGHVFWYTVESPTHSLREHGGDGMAAGTSSGGVGALPWLIGKWRRLDWPSLIGSGYSRPRCGRAMGRCSPPSATSTSLTSSFRSHAGNRACCDPGSMRGRPRRSSATCSRWSCGGWSLTACCKQDARTLRCSS